MDAMDFLTRYWTTIKNQLTGLTLSQRLLIGTLVVIMLGTIALVTQFSAKAEMAEVLPQSATPEEVATMTAYLKGKYKYEVNGDKILVPAELAYQIRGELAAAQALPRDTTVAFTKLMEASDFMYTQASSDRRWNVARQEVLSRVIRNFPYVADATVFISLGNSAGLGRSAIPSTATVTLRMKGQDTLGSNQVLAIVDTIRGSVAGLKREDVHVTDGTRSYTTPSEDSPIPTDMPAFKKSLEDAYTTKLRNLFDYMGDVKIAVNAVPDMSAATITKESYDPKGIASIAVEEVNKESTSSDGVGGGGEPGVRPNVAASATGTTGGSRNATSTSDSNTRKEVRFSSSAEKRIVPSGTELKYVSASISVPRSYFVALFRRSAGDAKAEPKDEQLQGTIDSVLKRVEAQTIPILKTAMDSQKAIAEPQVRADWFDDITIPRVDLPEHGSPATLLAGGNMSAMVAQYAKQAILGGIAVGALLMMLMMVRRAAPSAVGAMDADPTVFLSAGGKAAARKRNEPGALDVDDDVIGEAGQSEAVLTGIELDDETLASRKMVDEVSLMIKENPENAASLVKRWITKGK